MTFAPITTEQRLARYSGETQIPVDQLTLVVAKSALIRHLAADPVTRERFVVKGGTLLYHAYRGPRVSFKDVDFAQPSTDRTGSEMLAADDLQRELEAEIIEKMTIDTPEFQLRVGEGTIKLDLTQMVEVTRAPFTITGLRRRGDLKLTVSVRESERIGPPATVSYTDELLEGEQTFDVAGLSIEELAAEKIIGWSLRGLPKHYVDLAIIGHRYGTEMDQVAMTEILAEKVRRERAHPQLVKSYNYHRVRTVGDLVRRFDTPELAGAMHDRKYAAKIGDEIVLDDSSERGIVGLESASQVKGYVRASLGATLDELKAGE